MPADPVTRPDLSAVTLVAVSSVALDATARALALSLDQAAFAGALLLSDRAPPGGLPAGIEWRPIPALTSRQAYSRFVFNDLASHIATSHVLMVQWDGYVIDGSAWDPAFLDYDYIGAPWVHFADQHVVGNGGFSLRSRRLLDSLATCQLGAGEAEDLAICRRLRPELEQRHAIRFAPVDVAARFAWERQPRAGQAFGFHGVFNMPALMPPHALSHLLSAVEPHVVRPHEDREIVLGLLRRGAFANAARLLPRLWRNRGAAG